MPSTPSSALSDPGSDAAAGPSRRARWILAGIAVVVVLVVGVVTWVVVAGGDDDPGRQHRRQIDVPAGGPQAGDVAPDFTATTLDGDTVKLSDYAWASSSYEPSVEGAT